MIAFFGELFQSWSLSLGLGLAGVYIIPSVIILACVGIGIWAYRHNKKAKNGERGIFGKLKNFIKSKSAKERDLTNESKNAPVYYDIGKDDELISQLVDQKQIKEQGINATSDESNDIKATSYEVGTESQAPEAVADNNYQDTFEISDLIGDNQVPIEIDDLAKSKRVGKTVRYIQEDSEYKK